MILYLNFHLGSPFFLFQYTDLNKVDECPPTSKLHALNFRSRLPKVMKNILIVESSFINLFGHHIVNPAQNFYCRTKKRTWIFDRFEGCTLFCLFIFFISNNFFRKTDVIIVQFDFQTSYKNHKMRCIKFILVSKSFRNGFYDLICFKNRIFARYKKPQQSQKKLFKMVFEILQRRF